MKLLSNIEQLVASGSTTVYKPRAAKAKERHDRVLQHFQKNFVDVDNAKQLLSAPNTTFSIPFPYAEPALPPRFNPGGRGQSTYTYVGREEFANILDSFLQTLHGSQTMDLWLCGPIGYGKSHLLATVSYCLAALGWRVIYLPNCRVFANMPFVYMQTALLFAWADNPVVTKRILSLQTMDDIKRFFRNAPGQMVFVVDHINVLDEDEEALKVNARTFLHECRGGSRTFFGTSTNHLKFRATRHQQRNEKTIHVYGGFTNAELNAWWDRNKGLGLQNFTRKYIEDFTGRLPLLLDNCHQDGKLDFNTPELKTIARQTRRFAQKMKQQQPGSLWTQYHAYVRACIEERHVADDIPDELAEHPYLYEINGIGKCTCGLVRNAITKKFIELGEEVFTTRDILDMITKWIDNPSVTRFFLETAALSSIATNGLPAIDIGGPMKQKVFDGSPRYDLETSLVLYVPLAYYHPAVDAIIADLDQEKRTIHLYPIQITVARRHKSSEAAFFANWRNWCAGLYDYEVSVTFLWIYNTDKDTPSVEEPRNRVFRSKIYPQSLEYEAIHLPLSTITPAAWARCQAAKIERALMRN